MTQNRSSAVMAQRHEALDSLDDFPTHPWATRALVEHVLRRLPIDPRTRNVWEPACNRGYMALPLAEYFRQVIASDIFDYGFRAETPGKIVCAGLHDFTGGGLFATRPPAIGPGVDWIITNPPFNDAKAFVARALKTAREGVAVLVRSNWLETDDRYSDFFDRRPPTVIAQFVERVPLVRGRLTMDVSTATAYSWFIWLTAEDPLGPSELPEYRGWWIAPCRDRLQRRSDYPTDKPGAGVLL